MSFNFTISLVDTGDFVSAATESLLIDNLAAALQEWNQFLSGVGSIEVELSILNTGFGTAEGGAATNVVIDQAGPTSIVESSVAHELRTGFDATGDGADAEIFLDPDFLANELWVDPTPFDRSDGPPEDLLDAIGLFSHEFAHTLGVNGFIDDLTFEVPNDFITNYDQLVAISGQQAFFTGSMTTAAYGGPLPLTALSSTQNIYHFGDDEGLGPDLFGSLLNGTGQFAGDRYGVEALTLLIFADLGLDVTIPDSLPFVDPFMPESEPTLTVEGASLSSGQVSATLRLSAPNPFFFIGATVALQDASGTVVGAADRVMFAPGQNILPINLAVPPTTDPGGLFLVIANPSGAQLETGTRFLTLNLGDEPGVISGTGGPDVLAGSASADTILGLAGDDMLTPAGGNDVVDGGAGFDTANFSGGLAGSTASLLIDGRVVVFGPDGRDVLSNVELLSFQDGSLETALLANTPSPIDPAEVSDVFRFFNFAAGGHFFTTSEAERNTVMNNPGFSEEGTGFRAIEAGVDVAGADDVFRFFNSGVGGHFFTTSEAERDAVMTLEGFIFENVGFQAFAEQVEGTVPVFRFFNANAGGHFFSTDIGEVDLAEDLPGFTLEGVGFYAFPDDVMV